MKSIPSSAAKTSHPLLHVLRADLLLLRHNVFSDWSTTLSNPAILSRFIVWQCLERDLQAGFVGGKSRGEEGLLP